MSGSSLRADLVDFHCHFDLYPDYQALIEECERIGIRALAVTTTPRAWRKNCELASGSKFVRVALGLHPELVQHRADEIALFERFLSETRYIGEVGIDARPQYRKSLELQFNIFRRILQLCAEQGNKILTIHCTRAASSAFDLIENNLPRDRGKVVVHWFTGNKSEALRGVALGCYFSINERMLCSPKHRTLIESIPRNRILTETDGPFIQREGRPIRPSDISNTITELAKLYDEPVDKVARTVIDNLRTLVS